MTEINQGISLIIITDAKIISLMSWTYMGKTCENTSSEGRPDE